MEKSENTKNSGKWYCLGQYFKEDGCPCKYDEGPVFGYVPVFKENESECIRKDWMFDSKNECSKMCRKLTSKVQKNMQKHGYLDFRTYRDSRSYMTDTMMTIGDLVKYLKTLDQDSLILRYDDNSFAYCPLSKRHSDAGFRTVEEDKKIALERMEMFYKALPKKIRKKKIDEIMEEDYRYAENTDLVF